MNIDKIALGNRIQSIRKQLGKTLKDFGYLIGNADKSLVSRWEKGLTIPNNSRLKLIANAGAISVNELLYGSLENFRYSVINELFELHFIQSGIKENNPDLYYFFGGEDLKKIVYNNIDTQDLGYEDGEKIDQEFRMTYLLKFFEYNNKQAAIGHQLDEARRDINLNLIMEYFDREIKNNENLHKKNVGEFVPLNPLDAETPVNIHLDDIKLSDDEVKQLQNVIEKIQKNRNKK